ncbi:MAG TPA: FKBP-type peptidyl-prolyl cis-trans isomerase [Candidatus Thermoplasmatota archaeon]|nr:FKBP-type peptidyl-prolyl cis-trans isomerase [Candidatus Thermoplasmatota archaeon]
MSFTPLHALALVVFAGAVAGATYGVQQILDDPPEPTGVAVQPETRLLTIAPGQEASIPVTLRNRDNVTRDLLVVAEGPGVSGEARASVPARNATTVLLPLAFSGAERESRVALRVVEGNETLRETPDAFRVRAASGQGGFAPGDSASVYYTARMGDTGLVFYSNDPNLADANLAAVEGYRHAQDPILVRTVPEPSVIQGLYEGMLGMQEGETRHLEVPPRLAFGETIATEERDRVERIDRVSVLPIVERTAALASFERHLAETGQGNVSDYEAGDTFFITDPRGADLAYLVVSIDAASVTYRYAPAVGDRYTLEEAWPNASEVISVDAGNVTFRTTPPVDAGETTTWHAYWPNMSVVESVDESVIVVRHSPPVGTTHREPQGPNAPPLLYTVRSLTDDKVVLEYPNEHPLAGKTLVFDLRIADLNKGS